MSNPLPKRIGDYEVLTVLGAGGMGRVYKVRNVITDRVEAMKVLLPDLEGHEGVAARFLREIKVLAALNHPNIASLHTALTIDNQLVMVMEYVEGQSLSSRLNMGPIPVPEALNYLDQVLSALSYAHQQHVIHRDIKPANMMLTPEGTVKLMDFGIARTENENSNLTAPGSTLGSMNYMSPEQVKGEATDERSDLYSLGISLYEMVTGEKPFQGDSNFSIMAAHINQAPRPPVELHPGIPPLVNDVILTSIAKAPEQRFQSAEAFRFAVQRVMQSIQDDRTVMQGSNEGAATNAGFGNVTPVPTSRSAVAMAAKGNTPVLPPRMSPPPLPPNAAKSASTMPVAAAPAAAPSSGSRGLYMGLGALILLVVIAVAGVYLPGRKKAAAAESETRLSTTTSAQSAAPTQSASTNSAPTASAPTTVAQTTAPQDAAPQSPTSGQTSAQQPAAKRFAKSEARPELPAKDDSAAKAAQAAEAAKAAELDEVEKEIDQLTSRAGAVNSGLENLQRQQQAAGYGLRGDMAGKWSSMKVNLAKAQDAIGHNDAVRAKRYAGLASADIEALEKFLGR